MSDSNPRYNIPSCAAELDRISIGYIQLTEAVGGRLGVTAHRDRDCTAYPREIPWDADAQRLERELCSCIRKSRSGLILGASPCQPGSPEAVRAEFAAERCRCVDIYTAGEKGYTDYPAMETGSMNETKRLGKQ